MHDYNIYPGSKTVKDPDPPYAQINEVEDLYTKPNMKSGQSSGLYKIL